MRVSLISLAGVIAFGLFAYLILALPHPEWRGLVENTLAVLTILMLVAAFAGKHRSRAFGVGFVAATALYLSACFAPAISFRDRLFTHHALQYARQHCAPDVESSIAFNSPNADSLRIPALSTTQVASEPVAELPGDASLLNDREADEGYFFVGHLMWSILIGFVGGILGAAMTDSGRQSD